MRDLVQKTDGLPAAAKVVIDYAGNKNDPGPWLPDDASFGPGPVPAGEIILGTAANRPIARVAEVGSAQFDRAFDGLRIAPGTQNESGSLGGAMRRAERCGRRSSRWSMAGLSPSSRGAA